MQCCRGSGPRHSTSGNLHLAAQASVTSSVAEPLHDCMTNVIGTFNVLQAATREAVPVVFSSTGGALYGNDAPVPTSEQHIPAPLSPYGASKWAGEAYVSTWGRAHGIPHSICRLGNVYGPRQNPSGEAGVVFTESWRTASTRRPRLSFSATDADPRLHTRVGCRPRPKGSAGAGGVFNISTGIQTDVLTLWNLLARIASTDLAPRLEPLREGELESSGSDPSLASAALGWKAETPLDEGLEGTYRALLGEFDELPAST